MNQLLYIAATVGIGATVAVAQPDETPPPTAREAAAWALEVGGRIEIAVSGDTRRTFGPRETLPSGDWRLVRVDLRGCRQVTDDALQKFKGLADLEELNLSYTRIADKVVAVLTQLPALRRLYLASTGVTDIAAARLADRKSLTSLDLSDTAVTDAGIAKLSSLEELTDLFISRTKTTGAGLAAFANHQRLQTLHVAGVTLGPDGREALKSLGSLRELAISPARSDWTTIADLAELRRLFLYGPQVRDADLNMLTKNPQLERLYLGYTSVTKSAVAELRSTLPKCRVSGHPFAMRSAFLVGEEKVVRWQPGEKNPEWRGLVARPAALSGIKRWQVETVAPHSEIADIAFSPDGKRVALGTRIGYLRIYDAQSFQLLALIPALENGVQAVAWSPDGEWIACGGHSTRIRWFTPEGKPGPTVEVEKGPVMALAWSPDGQTLASGSWNGVSNLWTRDGKAGPKLKASESGITALAWRPDGQQLATGSVDSFIHIWNPDGTQANTLIGHQSRIAALAWKPDGSVLVSASQDKRLRFWQPNGTLQRELPVDGQNISDLAWRADGLQFATCAGPEIKLWNADGTPLMTLPRQQEWTVSLAYTPDGQELFSGNRMDSLLQVWSSEGKLLRKIGDRSDAGLNAVTWHPGGETLSTGGRNQAVRTWQADGTPTASLPAGSNSTNSVDYDFEGLRLAFCGWQIIWTWDTTPLPQHVYRDFKSKVNGVKWSPNGQLLASAHSDQTVRIWNGAKPPTVLKGHSQAVMGVCWNLDGTQLASVSGDKSLRLWPADGGEGRILAETTSGLNAVSWQPNGNWLAIGGWDGRVRLFDSESTAGPVFSPFNGVTSLGWSPDGQRIVVGCDTRGVLVYGLDGKVLHDVKDHGGRVAGVAFSPDGRRLASVSWDCTLRVYEAVTYAPLWTALTLADEEVAVFTPSGQLLHGNLEELETALVYLIETDDGRTELLAPSAFDQRLRGSSELDRK